MERSQSTTGPTNESVEVSPIDLEGLVPPEVCRALYALASHIAAEHAIVEIGSYKGKSTCCLAAGARSGAGAMVWAVDPWDKIGNESGRFGFAEPETKEAFHRQVAAAGLSDRITAIQDFSVNAARRWGGPKVGLLYIDGNHSESAVRQDFRVWRPHLALGATVVFDDLDTPRNKGVRKAVESISIPWEKWAGRLAVGRYS